MLNDLSSSRRSASPEGMLPCGLAVRAACVTKLYSYVISWDTVEKRRENAKVALLSILLLLRRSIFASLFLSFSFFFPPFSFCA